MATPRRAAATTDAPELDVSYHAGGPREPRKFQLSPAWVALGFSLFGAFWQVAVTSQRVNEDTRRIELLEQADRQRGDAVGRIDARTARIEATLDILTRGGMRGALSSPLPSPDQPGGLTP